MCNAASGGFDACPIPHHHAADSQTQTADDTLGDVLDFPTHAPGTAQHYVRVTRTHPRGYIEFQFSIGDPSLYLEMTLPPAAFDEFCARHAAVHLSIGQAAAVDIADLRWHAGSPTTEDSHVD